MALSGDLFGDANACFGPIATGNGRLLVAQFATWIGTRYGCV